MKCSFKANTSVLNQKRKNFAVIREPIFLSHHTVLTSNSLYRVQNVPIIGRTILIFVHIYKTDSSPVSHVYFPRRENKKEASDKTRGGGVFNFQFGMSVWPKIGA